MGIKEGREKGRERDERGRRKEKERERILFRGSSEKLLTGSKTRFVDISLETDVGFFNFNRN